MMRASVVLPLPLSPAMPVTLPRKALSLARLSPRCHNNLPSYIRDTAAFRAWL